MSEFLGMLWSTGWPFLLLLVLVFVVSIVPNLLIMRRIKRRGYWVVTIGGPNDGHQRWVSGPDDDTGIPDGHEVNP